jgi:N4-gp56 family major capsid protein
MVATVYGDISLEDAGYMVRKMLDHANPELVLTLFGQSEELPEDSNDTVIFTRAVPFAVSTAPLVEGVTPSSQKLTYERVKTKIEQYGNWVEITDKAEDLAKNPRKALDVTQMLLGEQAGKTVEMVTYGKVKAGTNVFYDTNTHASRAAVDSKITKTRLRAVVRSLKANLASFVTQMVSASPNYKTEPLAPAFIGLVHTDAENDIRELAGFAPVELYAKQGVAVHPYEIGKVENIRIICSPMLEPFIGAGASVGSTGMVGTTNIDVYPMLIFGKNAYGTIPLKGKNAIVPKVLAADRPDKSDPLGQRGSASWKAYHAAAILNELWIARLEIAVTAI